MPEQTVLVVDPDLDARKEAVKALEKAGYKVLVADRADTVRRLLKHRPIHIIILEAELPDMSGLTLVRKLRRDPATSTLPLLMLSGVGPDEDLVVRALGDGVDDVVSKPAPPAILVARVGAAVRRHGWEAQAESEVLALRSFRVDLARHTVRVRNREVRLTPKEFAILSYFMRHPDIVFSKRQLLFSLWGSSSSSSTQTVERQIESLRRKLGKEGRSIITVPKVGYRFQPV